MKAAGLHIGGDSKGGRPLIPATLNETNWPENVSGLLFSTKFWLIWWLSALNQFTQLPKQLEHDDDDDASNQFAFQVKNNNLIILGKHN